MEVVDLDKLFAELDPPDGVAHLVQGWRPEADAHHVGNDHHQGPADSRLGRKANLKEAMIWLYQQTDMN